MRSITCAVVGDSRVGKTCLLLAHTTNTFFGDYMPCCIDDTHTIELNVENECFRMNLWDTAGQDESDRSRPLCYPAVDVFLICFSVDNQYSFENVRNKWHRELQHYRPNAPIVLVGTKLDLRDENNPAQITQKQGVALAKKIKAAAYLECSASKFIGLKEIFNDAARSVLLAEGRAQNHKSKCCILN